MNNSMMDTQRLNSYTNLKVINRYVGEYGIPFNTAANRFHELKSFLHTCAIADRPCVPTKNIDDIWHTFILFTQDYQNFCMEYLGKFIHHYPYEKAVGNKASCESSDCGSGSGGDGGDGHCAGGGDD